MTSELINRVGGLNEAKAILACPLEIRSSHFNVKDKTYLAKLKYIQTKPWRLITTTEPEDMVLIDEPNLEDLIELNKLSAEVVGVSFGSIETQCVIFNSDSGLLVESSNGKGKATYYTRNIENALHVPVHEALDIISNMRCSDEERSNFKILKPLT